MVIAIGLISSLLNIALFGDIPFCQLQQHHAVLASWFYQNLSLFAVELHSFLHCHVDDDLRYARYGFGTI